MSTAPKTKSAPAAETTPTVESGRKVVRKIPEAEMKDLHDRLFASPNGSKSKVFRALFVRGFTINEVYHNCHDTIFPQLLRQHVQNEHKRWTEMKKKRAAQAQVAPATKV